MALFGGDEGGGQEELNILFGSLLDDGQAAQKPTPALGNKPKAGPQFDDTSESEVASLGETNSIGEELRQPDGNAAAESRYQGGTETCLSIRASTADGPPMDATAAPSAANLDPQQPRVYAEKPPLPPGDMPRPSTAGWHTSAPAASLHAPTLPDPPPDGANSGASPSTGHAPGPERHPDGPVPVPNEDHPFVVPQSEACVRFTFTEPPLDTAMTQPQSVLPLSTEPQVPMDLVDAPPLRATAQSLDPTVAVLPQNEAAPVLLQKQQTVVLSQLSEATCPSAEPAGLTVDQPQDGSNQMAIESNPAASSCVAGDVEMGVPAVSELPGDPHLHGVANVHSGPTSKHVVEESVDVHQGNEAPSIPASIAPSPTMGQSTGPCQQDSEAHMRRVQAVAGPPAGPATTTALPRPAYLSDPTPLHETMDVDASPIPRPPDSSSQPVSTAAPAPIYADSQLPSDITVGTYDGYNPTVVPYATAVSTHAAPRPPPAQGGTPAIGTAPQTSDMMLQSMSGPIDAGQTNGATATLAYAASHVEQLAVLNPPLADLASEPTAFLVSNVGAQPVDTPGPSYPSLVGSLAVPQQPVADNQVGAALPTPVPLPTDCPQQGLVSVAEAQPPRAGMVGTDPAELLVDHPMIGSQDFSLQTSSLTATQPQPGVDGSPQLTSRAAPIVEQGGQHECLTAQCTGAITAPAAQEQPVPVQTAGMSQEWVPPTGSEVLTPAGLPKVTQPGHHITPNPPPANIEALEPTPGHRMMVNKPGQAPADLLPRPLAPTALQASPQMVEKTQHHAPEEVAAQPQAPKPTLTADPMPGSHETPAPAVQPAPSAPTAKPARAPAPLPATGEAMPPTAAPVLTAVPNTNGVVKQQSQAADAAVNTAPAHPSAVSSTLAPVRPASQKAPSVAPNPVPAPDSTPEVTGTLSTPLSAGPSTVREQPTSIPAVFPAPVQPHQHQKASFATVNLVAAVQQVQQQPTAPFAASTDAPAGLQQLPPQQLAPDAASNGVESTQRPQQTPPPNPVQAGKQLLVPTGDFHPVSAVQEPPHRQAQAVASAPVPAVPQNNPVATTQVGVGLSTSAANHGRLNSLPPVHQTSIHVPDATHLATMPAANRTPVAATNPNLHAPITQPSVKEAANPSSATAANSTLPAPIAKPSAAPATNTAKPGAIQGPPPPTLQPSTLTQAPEQIGGLPRVQRPIVEVSQSTVAPHGRPLTTPPMAAPARTTTVIPAAPQKAFPFGKRKAPGSSTGGLFGAPRMRRTPSVLGSGGACDAVAPAAQVGLGQAPAAAQAPPLQGNVLAAPLAAQASDATRPSRALQPGQPAARQPAPPISGQPTSIAACPDTIQAQRAAPTPHPAPPQQHIPLTTTQPSMQVIPQTTQPTAVLPTLPSATQPTHHNAPQTTALNQGQSGVQVAAQAAQLNAATNIVQSTDLDMADLLSGPSVAPINAVQPPDGTKTAAAPAQVAVLAGTAPQQANNLAVVNKQGADEVQAMEVDEAGGAAPTEGHADGTGAAAGKPAAWTHTEKLEMMILQLEEMHERVLELRLEQAMTSNKLAMVDTPQLWERIAAARKRLGMET